MESNERKKVIEIDFEWYAIEEWMRALPFRESAVEFRWANEINNNNGEKKSHYFAIS